MKKKFALVFIALFFLGILFTACDNPTDPTGPQVSYPYTEHEIRYLGLKSDLTSSSSDQAFDNGLDEIFQAYFASHPNSSDEIIFDGVTYELTNVQTITGGVPSFIWDQYWDGMEEYSYSVGSCWGFVYIQIPSKRGTGTVYGIRTIVTYVSAYGNSEVRYNATRGDVRPKN
jgi:hypothetical protein